MSDRPISTRMDGGLLDALNTVTAVTQESIKGFIERAVSRELVRACEDADRQTLTLIRGTAKLRGVDVSEFTP